MSHSPSPASRHSAIDSTGSSQPISHAGLSRQKGVQLNVSSSIIDTASQSDQVKVASPARTHLYEHKKIVYLLVSRRIYRLSFIKYVSKNFCRRPDFLPYNKHTVLRM